ncbi:MAG: DNA replication/repair protein RecF [Clostridiales bacterium]|nr:MAG: DNA replication/repair protein RecF [Clostridiales bacterium]
MKIQRAKLINYRNYKSEDFEFREGINFILGNNAQGKTNLLESIYLACTGRSFRTNRIKELFNSGTEPFFVELKFSDSDDSKFIYLNKENRPSIKVNNFEIKGRSELFGRFPMILFSPIHLLMVSEGPNKRRKFLDREISLIDKNYFINLLYYNKYLSSRNKLLREEKFDERLIEIYEEKLSEYAFKIIKKRIEFTEKLNSYSQEIHSYFTENNEKLKITYSEHQNWKNNQKYDKIIQDYVQKHRENRRRDIKTKRTNFGPHLHDLNIDIDGREIRKFASQGQLRLSAITIFFSLIPFIEEELGKKPIILLDDVFSELDKSRKTKLLEVLDGYQTIITATDLDGVPIKIENIKNIIEIENGTLRRQI